MDLRLVTEANELRLGAGFKWEEFLMSRYNTQRIHSVPYLYFIDLVSVLNHKFREQEFRCKCNLFELIVFSATPQFSCMNCSFSVIVLYLNVFPLHQLSSAGFKFLNLPNCFVFHRWWMGVFVRSCRNISFPGTIALVIIQPEPSYSFYLTI